MTRSIRPILTAALVLAAGAAAADTTAPDDVAFDDYGAVETALTDAPGDVANGQALMNKGAGNCIACHRVSTLDLPFQGEIGPPLDGVADRWSPAELRGIVADAKRTFPGTMMPSFYKTHGYVRPGDAYTGKAAADPENLPPLLDAQQVEDVVAYLSTLTEG